MIQLTCMKGSFYAVPYRDGEALQPMLLPNGTFAEKPGPHQRGHAPEAFPGFLALDAERRPHPDGPFVEDDDFGEIFVGFSGLYVLSTGEVVAAYGCNETIAPWRN